MIINFVDQSKSMSIYCPTSLKIHYCKVEAGTSFFFFFSSVQGQKKSFYIMNLEISNIPGDTYDFFNRAQIP